jgi:hypothetical protein
MPSQPRAPRIRRGEDGVRVIENAPWRRFAWLASVAIGTPIVLVVVAVVVIRLSAPAPVIAPPPAPAPVLAAQHPRPPSERTATGSREPAGRRAAPRRRTAGPRADTAQPPVSPPASDVAREELEVDAADAIQVLRDEGVTHGIAAFGLPGTDPPKPGVIVPDDFALPEGFVRHYQTTDDGEQLPAVLTVHPDYDLVDAAGHVVPRPPDGIVPPELAPDGLPIEILEVPARRTRTSDPP